MFYNNTASLSYSDSERRTNNAWPVVNSEKSMTQSVCDAVMVIVWLHTADTYRTFDLLAALDDKAHPLTCMPSANIASCFRSS